jgi:predicted phosphoribosyltransferase
LKEDILIFHDRIDAGKKLAKHLQQYAGQPDVVVIGLPRGGVVVAAEVARELQVSLDIIIPRKIGAPGQEELAVGALTEDGTVQLNEELMQILGLSSADLTQIIEREKQEAKRRLKLYRGNRPPRILKDKTVILVDDGIATGSTIQAAIASAYEEGAKKIIVAIPVGPAITIKELKKEVDEVVCLQMPESFLGVSQFYRNFAQTSDEKVIRLMHDIHY